MRRWMWEKEEVILLVKLFFFEFLKSKSSRLASIIVSGL